MKMRSISLLLAVSALLLISGGQQLFSQRLAVKVTNRQENDRTYSYIVATRNAALGQTLTLSGATLMLELPDGRMAVVNCKGVSKSSVIHPRDCRVPLIDAIDVDFHGDNAKLYWPVSLDGKKIQSETYKIISILDASQKQPSGQ
jgi:hypothetical protein